jgi:ureidoglycolate lyase
MKTLSIQPLSREAFAPFGEVIMLEGAKHYPINAGTTERFHALAGVDASEQNGLPIISLFRGQPHPLPLPITVMERHPLGSQAFVPVTQSADDEYLVVVAPPGEFDAAQLKAFLARGFQGVSYARGVWHHPLISLHKVSDFVIVDRIGPGNNCDEIPLDGQIVLTDKALALARQA